MNFDFSYGSVCSGVEAATVAWHMLGWRASWFAEIEPNPSKVLAYRWPNVPNLGDMTKIARFVRIGYVEAPDVLVGGTPCQAFSVAGLRGGLTDARGQLTLTYVDLANAIDERRAADGKPPCVIVWENVPGVLSDKSNAFGCFLAGLVGETEPLVAPGGKWPNAGLVAGPQRVLAWRVLDAQFFGVAQRRRRVFVVSSARDGFDPGALLFELGSLRRDSAPRRETREETAAGTLRCTDGGCDVDHALAGHLLPLAFGGNNQSGPIDVATARNACSSSSGRLDFESETFLVDVVCVTGDITHTLKAEGFDASEDGTGRGDMGELCNALTAQAGETGKGDAAPHVAYAATDYKTGAFEECDTARTLTTSEDRTRAAPIAVSYRPAAPGVVWRVRRLTPRECERLQGFPDDHTLVPDDRRAAGRGAPRMMADGPRYKAMGNSMCVYVMRWLGVRLVITHPQYFY